MTRRLTIVLGLVLLVSLVPLVRADSPADAEARLRADLLYLAADECEGRGITTKGIGLAAEYVARQFGNAHLKPGGPDGTYFQSFSLVTAARAGTNNSLTLRGPQGQAIDLEAGKHFSVALLGGAGKVDAPVVFAGYGLTSDAPKYDDYAGLDVAGKVVVVLTGTPRRGQRYADVFAADDRPNPQGGLRAKLENASRHKAAAVLVVNATPSPRFGDSLPRPSYTLRDGDPVALPAVHLRRDWAQRMLNAADLSLADLEKDIDATLKPHSVPLPGWTCRLETGVAHTRVTVRNVIGVLEGDGPLAKETVVIGAHYDHIGLGTDNRLFNLATGVAGPGSPGGVGFPLAEMAGTAVHHGADDNASGTIALLELARRFGAAKERAGRRLVFIAFTAEESGLIGSRYYCNNPVFPLKDTAAMLNMDMVGRLQDDKLMVGGLASARPFAALVDRLNDKHHFDLLKEPSGQGPSDHSSFEAKKVPVLNLFTGFHEQYHRPSDRPETIDVAGVYRVVGFAADLVAELATTSRPEYAKSGPYNRTKTLWSSAPSTGVLPDYSDKKEGVLVGGVVSGTPGAKAGLKKGDRISAVAGKPVKDPVAFLAVTRTLAPGTKVALAVEREGKAQTIELQLVRIPPGVQDRRLGWFVDLAADLKDGLLLAEVPEDSPAGKAGLKKQDRVTVINGESIADVAAYATAVRALQPGDKVAVTAVRDGKPRQFLAVAADLAPPRPAGARFGIVPDFNDDKAGALVRSVREGTPADAAGLREGDRITAVNGQAVKDVRTFAAMVRELRDGDKVELTFVRDGKEQKGQAVMK
ncbi:MAG TPA: M28 family peptidase [Gemmataceae bacterium]|nr:M28 family peptidase [Gemmataceae bacterium]